jgi:hypothetical protein
LVGVWAFALRNGLRRLAAPAHPLGALATPVVDGSCIEEVLDAWFDAVAADPGLPQLIELDAMDYAGPIHSALIRVLAARCSVRAEIDARERAQLLSNLDGKSYLKAALSAHRRANLRNRRNRLKRLGALSHVRHETAGEVAQALEAFLALEASGWKGRRGSALLSDGREAAFTRKAVTALAAEGLASVSALYLDGRALSMGIILKSGRVASIWKIAYDESMRSFSPGYLLFENDTERFLRDPALDSVDSTSARDIGLFAEIWTERKPVANLVFDVRRSPPLTSRAAVAALAGVRSASLLRARLQPRARLARAATFAKGLLKTDGSGRS